MINENVLELKRRTEAAGMKFCNLQHIRMEGEKPVPEFHCVLCNALLGSSSGIYCDTCWAKLTEGLA
jgi:hypothetical protein